MNINEICQKVKNMRDTTHASDDMENWNVLQDIIDKADCDNAKFVFQYFDWIFDRYDIVYLCRTAMNVSDIFHNSNYINFGIIKKFRVL